MSTPSTSTLSVNVTVSSYRRKIRLLYLFLPLRTLELGHLEIQTSLSLYPSSPLSPIDPIYKYDEKQHEVVP